ncbi:hypothetical protein [Acidipila sp. EB88]|uniref:hypothetical protein n=1 Tax=Acidipila sp. EB88 TaxID=2305226 RepID=UPI000F5EC041|nr:hypothetical protein [Acidipila sp. EB88]RRA48644.1 hypothetical protein D1Y84_10470 [Acidipila sp. EB88]
MVQVAYSLANATGQILLSGSTTTNSSGQAVFTSNGLAAGSYVITFNAAGFPPYPLYLTVGPTGDEASLTGQYAFLVQGNTATSSGGAASKAAIAGSMTLDGKGNISSGVVDLNAATGNFQQLAVTGHYANYPGQGSIVLESSIGKIAFQFTGNPRTNPLQNAVFTILPRGPVYGTGVIAKQDPTSFSIFNDLQNLSYELALTGESPCASSCVSAAGNAFPVSATGSFTIDQNGMGTPTGTFNFEPAETFDTAVIPSTGFSGAIRSTSDSYGSADANGRAILTLNASSVTSGAATSYAFYRVDAAHFFMMSLDPHVSTILLSGAATQ